MSDYPSVHPNVVKGYERAFSNMKAATDAAKRQAERAKHEAAFWCDAWETLLGDLSDLVERVKEKPKGHQRATLRELQRIIKRQAEPCADEPLRHRGEPR